MSLISTLEAFLLGLNPRLNQESPMQLIDKHIATLIVETLTDSLPHSWRRNTPFKYLKDAAPGIEGSGLTQLDSKEIIESLVMEKDILAENHMVLDFVGAFWDVKARADEQTRIQDEYKQLEIISRVLS